LRLVEGRVYFCLYFWLLKRHASLAAREHPGHLAPASLVKVMVLHTAIEDIFGKDCKQEYEICIGICSETAQS